MKDSDPDSQNLQHPTLKSLTTETDLERSSALYLLNDPLGKNSTNSVTQC